MKFTKIHSEKYAMKIHGYRFMFLDGEPAGFGESELAFANDQDSLYDLDGTEVCLGDDGNVYGVLFGWRKDDMIPVVWQRIYQAEPDTSVQLDLFGGTYFVTGDDAKTAAEYIGAIDNMLADPFSSRYNYFDDLERRIEKAHELYRFEVWAG